MPIYVAGSDPDARRPIAREGFQEQLVRVGATPPLRHGAGRRRLRCFVSPAVFVQGPVRRPTRRGAVLGRRAALHLRFAAAPPNETSINPVAVRSRLLWISGILQRLANPVTQTAFESLPVGASNRRLPAEG